MTTDEYVPSDEDFIDSWACAHVTPHDMTAEEAKDAARAFLAQVRRDAAREALDGLINECRTAHEEAATNNRVGRMVLERHAQEVAMNYRATHYPEETS